MTRRPWPELREAVAAWYDGRAEAYAAQTAGLDLSAAYARFLARVPAGGRILDAGCGAGRDSAYFLSLGHAVEAFDVSPAMARLAAARTGLPVRVLDLMDAPWEAAFEGVWAQASLLHTPRELLGQALTRLGRALVPDGALLASFKHGERAWEKQGLPCYALDEAGLKAVLAGTPWLRAAETWLAPDDRPGRGSERWFNVVLQPNRI